MLTTYLFFVAKRFSGLTSASRLIRNDKIHVFNQTDEAIGFLILSYYSNSQFSYQSHAYLKKANDGASVHLLIVVACAIAFMASFGAFSGTFVHSSLKILPKKRIPYQFRTFQLLE